MNGSVDHDLLTISLIGIWGAVAFGGAVLGLFLFTV